MVATLADQLPVTPAGNPLNVAPVAPVVAKLILVIAVLIHVVRFSPAAIVLFGFTVIVPVAVFVPPVQPPVIVTV